MARVRWLACEPMAGCALVVVADDFYGTHQALQLARYVDGIGGCRCVTTADAGPADYPGIVGIPFYFGRRKMLVLTDRCVLFSCRRGTLPGRSQRH